MRIEIDQINIGGRQVGVVNLRTALADVRKLDLKEPDDIKSRLLDILKEFNYLPPGTEASYGDALYREYIRSSGENVHDDSSEMEILILGPGCPRCDEMYGRVITVAAEMGLAADIRHEKDLKKIGDYGTIATPALIVNGRIRSMGKVPSKEELRNILS
jgi:small redox-active disulfide protein 2